MSAGCFSRTPYSDPLATCVTGRTVVERSTDNVVTARAGADSSGPATSTNIADVNRLTCALVGADRGLSRIQQRIRGYSTNRRKRWMARSQLAETASRNARASANRCGCSA